MDQTIDNVFIIHKDLLSALDQTVWLNFKVRSLECQPFYLIENESDEFAVVSDDVLEFLYEYERHPLIEDYSDLDSEGVKHIISTPKRLEHWSAIYDAFANIPTEILIFIIEMKVPLEIFIRQELVFRKKDKYNKPCSKEKAEQLWLNKQ